MMKPWVAYRLFAIFMIFFAVNISVHRCSAAGEPGGTAAGAAAPAAYTPPVFEGLEDFVIDIDAIRKEYDIDRSAPLDIKITQEKDMGAYTKIFFSYQSPNGGRVPAFIMMPKERVSPMKDERSTVRGAYPAVFFMHFHVSDKSMADIFASWPGHGIAVMAIDGVFRGDRLDPNLDVLMPDPFLSAKHIRMQVKDILRGFDVLSGWKGVDPGRIGYFGVSMGALTGTVATSLDSRIKSILLADGAADFSLMFENSDYGSLQDIKKYMSEHNMTKRDLVDAFKYVEPAVFAPLINDRPVLFVNGTQDTTMTMPAMKKLHELVASEKKKVIWYESGHILPPEKLVVDSLKWFKMTL